MALPHSGLMPGMNITHAASCRQPGSLTLWLVVKIGPGDHRSESQTRTRHVIAVIALHLLFRKNLIIAVIALHSCL